MYTTIINRLKIGLYDMIGDQSVAEYYDVKPSIGTLKIAITDFVDGIYRLKVKYNTIYKPNHDFRNLPVVINDIINSYLEDYIAIEFVVDLRRGFPFKKPIWHVVKVENSYGTRLPIDLFQYYKHIAKLHNRMHSQYKNWSPATGLKNDLIKFISRINHFEIFNEY